MEILKILEQVGNLPGICWLIPPALMVGAILTIPLISRARLLSDWETIARRLGLRLNRTNIFNSPIIEGDYGRYPVRVYNLSRRRGSGSSEGTQVEMKIANPEVIWLHMHKKVALDRVLGAVEGKGAPVGDEQFDHHFYIQSHNPEAMPLLFGPDEMLRSDLIRLDLYALRVTSTHLYGDLWRVERDGAHAEALLTALTSLADRIGGLHIETPPEIIQT